MTMTISGTNGVTLPDATVLKSAVPLKVRICDSQASGVEGGDSAVGEQTRRLTTIRLNEVGAGVTLNSTTGIITIPAGTWSVRGMAPAYMANRNHAWLANITDNLIVANGPSSYASASGSSGGMAFFEGKFTITSPKTFKVIHYFQTAQATVGLGTAAYSGQLETYTDIMFTKEPV